MKNKEKTESKFLKISCPRCGAPHIVFGKASTKIKCTSCNILLIKTTGGKTKIKASVKRVL